jgi:hypothetical protein
MPIIVNPAYITVFRDNPVFHIIQIIRAGGNLLPDTFLHSLQIIRMDNAPKRISRHFPELLQRITVKNPDHSLIGINDFFISVRMVDKKTSRHPVYKTLHAPRQFQVLPFRRRPGLRFLYTCQIIPVSLKIFQKNDQILDNVVFCPIPAVHTHIPL